jgi:serine/threonine-protein kinase
MALDTHGGLLADRYRKLGAIGVGGMARVYLAEDELLGRRVAVKVLHADSPDDAALRFQREAKLGASLNHPNLVSIFDIVTEEESVLIVMEYVDGETLKDAIGRGPLPPERAIAVVRDVAAGLDHAHAHGVVHRDVKPANILLRHDGIAKLADLGIATAAERTAITRSDVVLGTASYMAPEQLAGGRAGPATDLYALAAVAFEALSGHKARSGKTPVEVAHEVVSGGPPDIQRTWPDAPPAVASALARGMAREPGDRPRSAGALADELERGLRSRPRRDAAVATDPTAELPVARPPVGESPDRPIAASAAPRRAPRGSRRWSPLAAVAALLLALAVGGFALLGGGDEDAGGGADGRRATAGDRERADRSAKEGSRNDRATADRPAQAPAPATVPPAEPAPEPAPAAASDDPAALNDEGFRLMGAGRYDEAIPLLERAVSAYPEDSRDLTYGYALYNLGRSLRLAGRPAEAVPILERRLRIPNQTETVERELEAARQAAG